MANDNISLLEFRRIIATLYMTISSVCDPKILGRPSLGKASAKRVPDEIRKNLTGHVWKELLSVKKGNLLFA